MKKAKQGSDAVFIGKVLEISKTSLGHLSVKMKVVSTWKGLLSDELIVTTGAGGGDCGFPFEDNQEYLIYASIGDGSRFSTNICTRTASLKEAQNDIKSLGKLRRAKKI